MWTVDKLDDVEPAEAQELASFLYPNEALSPSGSAASKCSARPGGPTVDEHCIQISKSSPSVLHFSKLLVQLLTADVQHGSSPAEADPISSPQPEPNPATQAGAAPENAGELGAGSGDADDKASNSIADFKDVSISDGGPRRARRGKKKKKKKKPQKQDSSDGSSDDGDHDGGDGSEDEDTPEFCGLSPKFREIIKYQGGPGFAELFKPLALQVATEAELLESLSFYRGGIKTARALCCANNLSMSHSASKDMFQPKIIPIILPELRSQPHLSFPIRERVAPVGIRHFLQSGSIAAFTTNLAERSGSVNKHPADGYMAREILCTGHTLAALFDECHPYPTVFLSAVERLVRRMLVHEAAVALDKKDRSAFYEKNLAYMGIAPATAGKSLKHLL